MGLFDKIKEPIFLKESSTLPEQLAALESLLKTAGLDDAKKLEQEIRNVKAGMIGEQQIAFELKNSHIPMYVLHDLYLEHEGLTARIDYLVITRRRNFVIECKNLYGNIEITNQGDFIRNIGYGGKFFKERIYSPITQNERHLALIKQIRAAQKTNILTQALFEKYFAENYRSVVVLANPKTILNNKFAPKEIKGQVISADRLIAHMKAVNGERGAEYCFEKDMTALAEFFMEINQPAPDYIEKYREMCGETAGKQAASEVIPEPGLEQPAKAVPACGSISIDETEKIICPKCGAAMVLRTAKKGDNAGNTFYGCSRYPHCRGIVGGK